MKHKEYLLFTFAIALSFFLVAPVDSRAQSFLTRPIEFVCHAAAGGGSDIQARFIQSVIEKEKLCSQPVAVVNRAGGGGAIAFAYVAGKKGDPHFWLTATTSFLTTPLLGKSKYTYKDFTPITNLAYDDFLVTVRADSPWKTMKELVEDAKKGPARSGRAGPTPPERTPSSTISSAKRRA